LYEKINSAVKLLVKSSAATVRRLVLKWRFSDDDDDDDDDEWICGARRK